MNNLVRDCVKVAKLGTVWLKYIQNLESCLNRSYDFRCSIESDIRKYDQCLQNKNDAAGALADLRWHCRDGYEYHNQDFRLLLQEMLEKPADVPLDGGNSNSSNFISKDSFSDSSTAWIPEDQTCLLYTSPSPRDV
jgi:hypothetical protein